MTNKLGTEYLPSPIGASLTDEQKQRIAYTIYSRFIRCGTLPEWTSPLADDIQKSIVKGVNQVIDSLELNGFRIEQ